MNWQSQHLEECIERVKYDAKIPRSQFLDAGAYPIISQEADFINGFWDESADLFKVERPVVIFGDHTQVLKYVDFDFVIGADGVKVLKPKPFLETKYLYYFLRSAQLKRLGYARHYRLLARITVNFPPIPEQKRIVAILDEAFEGIDTVVANTEKNLANARQLFNSRLNSVVSDIWRSCKPATMADLATSITDGDHLPPPKASEGVPFITIGDINKDTREVDFSDTFMVGRSYFDALKENRKPKEGDVLYTVTGSYGIPVIVRGDKEFCFQRHIGLLTSR